MIGKIAKLVGWTICSLAIAAIFSVLIPAVLIAGGCLVILLALESGFDSRVSDDIDKMFGDDR